MHTLYSTLKCIICVATVMRQQHILNRDSRVTLHVLSNCMMYWLTASQEEPRRIKKWSGGRWWFFACLVAVQQLCYSWSSAGV